MADIAASPWLTWDPQAVLLHHAHRIVAENPDTTSFDDAVREACEDGDLLGLAWDDLCARITDWLDEHDVTRVHVTYASVGLYHLHGQKFCHVRDGRDLLNKVLSAEHSFNVWRDGNMLRIAVPAVAGPWQQEYLVVKEVAS